MKMMCPAPEHTISSECNTVPVWSVCLLQGCSTSLCRLYYFPPSRVQHLPMRRFRCCCLLEPTRASIPVAAPTGFLDHSTAQQSCLHEGELSVKGVSASKCALHAVLFPPPPQCCACYCDCFGMSVWYCPPMHRSLLHFGQVTFAGITAICDSHVESGSVDVLTCSIYTTSQHQDPISKRQVCVN